jgi:molybdopterin converting factor small subunit
MTQADIKIKFYGAFRKYGDQETISLPAGSSVDDLKNLLAKHLAGKVQNFSDAQLIRDSAIACNDTVVGSDYLVQSDEVVSVLPPVCGG